MNSDRSVDERNVREAYSRFRLPLNTPLPLVRNRYHQLIKSCHPDLHKRENENVYLLNGAYELIERYERGTVRFVDERTVRLETTYIGLAKMALKRYCRGLYFKKASYSGRHRAATAEMKAVRRVWREIGGALQDVHIESLIRTKRFLLGVYLFNRLPVRFYQLTARERLQVRQYIQLLKCTARLLEECFSRMDGVKRKTGLWREYLADVKERLTPFLLDPAPRFQRRLHFMVSFLDDMHYIIMLFSRHSAIVDFSDFYRFFKKSYV